MERSLEGTPFPFVQARCGEVSVLAVWDVSFAMNNSVVMLADKMDASSRNGLSSLVVLDMGYGYFPVKPETLELLTRKSNEDLYVPLILDLDMNSVSNKATRELLMRRFPAALVMCASSANILKKFLESNDAFSLYPGIGRSKYVFKAVQCAFRNLNDPGLDGTAMAKAAGIPLDQLIEEFHVTSHTTPKHCIIYLRMTQAKRLLWENESDINRVAMVVGYDPKYFSKAFKNFVRTTPTQYRAAHRPLPA